MLTISGGKWSGCAVMAVDSVAPPWTSLRTFATASLSFGFSICSSRIASERSRVSPDDVMDANCRAKIARSFRLVRPPKPGILISLLRPVPRPAISSGTSRWFASDFAAASGDSDSILPLTIAPVWSSAS